MTLVLVALAFALAQDRPAPAAVADAAKRQDATQVRGFQDETCPFELIAELLQCHPLHRLGTNRGPLRVRVG